MTDGNDQPPDIAPQPSGEVEPDPPEEAVPKPSDEPAASEIVAPSANAKDRRANQTIALIALSGVVIGAIIAGASSYLITRLTVAAQRQEQIDQYRRDQRRDVYVNTLNQLAALESAERDEEIAFIFADRQLIRSGGAADPTALEEYVKAIRPAADSFNKAYSALDAAVSGAELLSSRRVVGVSNALRDKHSQMFIQIALSSETRRSMLGRLLGDVFVNSGVWPGPTNVSPFGPPDTRQYDPALLKKSPPELKSLYIAYSKEDLGLND
ncbi:MAG: hypothetical protein JWR32_2995 [Mycobacterium sp.]|jgi:hypothetical protein|nr:hypothetical protein [Mycobacterium sp.]